MNNSTLFRNTALATLILASSAPVQAATFTDIAVSAGLGIHSRSTGWGDYDNDGCLDVMMTSDTSPKLFRNNCDGSNTFTDVSATAGITAPAMNWAAVWADVNGDDLLDVYLTAQAETTYNVLYINQGNGTFVADTSAPVSGRGSAGASFADYDGDGDLDLFVAGRFGSTNNQDALLRNDNGTFTDVTDLAGLGGQAGRLTFMGLWFDYDMDGDQDLYLTVDFGTDVLYQNNGDGTFTDVSLAAGIGLPQHGMGVYTGDLNNDGCLDIASSNNNGDTTNDPETDEHGPSIIYLNNCDGTFTVASYASGIADRAVVDWGLNFIDYDNDGDLDFSQVSGGMLSSGQPNAFYENDGSGQLFDITAAAGVSDSGDAFGSAWIDVDNDGDLDWFVSNSGNPSFPNALYRNDSATGHYLKVKLNGIAPNTDAVGATVKITAGSRTQMRVIQAGLSYGNSEELAAFFGLGVKTVADNVTVIWPNGTQSEVLNVAVDQTLVIDEDTSNVPLVGTVTGSVTDPNGLPLAGAAVSVRRCHWADRSHGRL